MNLGSCIESNVLIINSYPSIVIENHILTPYCFNQTSVLFANCMTYKKTNIKTAVDSKISTKGKVFLVCFANDLISSAN